MQWPTKILFLLNIVFPTYTPATFFIPFLSWFQPISLLSHLNKCSILSQDKEHNALKSYLGRPTKES